MGGYALRIEQLLCVRVLTAQCITGARQSRTRNQMVLFASHPHHQPAQVCAQLRVYDDRFPVPPGVYMVGGKISSTSPEVLRLLLKSCICCIERCSPLLFILFAHTCEKVVLASSRVSCWARWFIEVLSNRCCL